MIKRYTICDTGFKYENDGNILIQEVIKGNITEIKRFDAELDSKKVQHLCVEMQNCNEIFELIFKYTSIEARNFMNLMAKMNEAEVACGKNCKLFYLSDYNEKGKQMNLRLEHEGKHIKWLYDKEQIPRDEIINGEKDYSDCDNFWDEVFEDIKGVWCDKY